MSVPKLNAAAFEGQLKTGINARDTSADTDIGPIRDWVISPVARVFEGQNERIRQLYQLLALQRPNELDPADVDAFVFNEQVIRSPGSPGFVDLIFYRKTTPTANLPIPANFPVATDPDPTTGAQVVYVTLQSQQLLVATAGAYFNGITGRYELRIPAKSLIIGDSAGVSKNRLVRPLRPLPGFDGVVNDQDSRSSNPAETNVDVADRYFLRIRGTEIGTPAGLSRYVLQTFGTVEDIEIIFGNDSALTRADIDAGAVDAYIVGEAPLSITQTLPFPGKLNLMVLGNQPLVNVISVSSGPSFTEGVDFDVVYDSGIYSGSTKGKDGIRFRATGGSPNIGDPVNITYTYDTLTVALQSFFNTVEFDETGRDLLFRRGVKVQVALQGNLKVKAGDPNTVLSVVNQTILDFFNGSTVQKGLKLGDAVEIFDIDAQLSRIPGVDNFVYTLLARVGSTGVADIPIARLEYARLDPANLSVSLV